MNFPRRQHNATILADGSVLVTGGTRSGGPGPPQNFDNLDLGQPVHVAELWDPNRQQWTELAAEMIDRCYHSTAVLLPDATVLSAGGGEFFPIEAVTEENDPADSHRDSPDLLSSLPVQGRPSSDHQSTQHGRLWAAVPSRDAAAR